MRLIKFSTIALFAVSALAGCGRDEAVTTDTTAGDLALAGVDTTVQPQLKDVPAATTTPPKSNPPRVNAPAPTPPRVIPTPPPATGTIAAGSTLAMTSGSKICTNTNKIGDRFEAVLSSPVGGSNGISLPAGATATIELTELKRSEDSKGNIVIGFRVVSLTANGRTYQADAEVVSAEIDRVRSQDRGDDVKKVAGGAAAGAIVGQILGRDRKGTLIGAAVGAAAGAAAAATTSDYEGCVNAGAAIAVKLTSALTIVSAN